MVINSKVIDVAKAHFLDVNEIVYMYNVYFTQGWDLLITPGSILKLKRYGLLENDNTLTGVGESILFDCIEGVTQEQVSSDKFEELWVLFPKDDEFGSFPKTRTIRINKVRAKEEYIQALNRGATHDLLILGLKNELIDREQASTSENAFKYMRSPANWFKADTYLDYVNNNPANFKSEYGKQIL